jgi:hypothetical protein
MSYTQTETVMYFLFMGFNDTQVGGANNCTGVYPTRFDAKEAALAIMGEENMHWWHVAILEQSQLKIVDWGVSQSPS